MLTVSIIIPNYNNERYLCQCLESILAQSYPIKEIIVYDDCSTDGSGEILENYAKKDKRVHIIYGEKNVGVSTARDAAIRTTTSDYVCMLDADDYFFASDKIEREMKTAQKIYDATGKKVIVFSQTVDVAENGDPIEKPQHIDLKGNERFKIVTRAYSNFMPRDYCFPRDFYAACGGYTKELSLYEDWELNMKLLDYTDFVYSGGYGTAYRHKAGGLSSVNFRKQLITKKEIFRKYKTSFKEKCAFYIIAYGAYIKHRMAGD